MMTNKMTTATYNTFSIENIEKYLESKKARSAWDRGVKEYESELLEDLAERIDYERRTPANRGELVGWLLNGAESWDAFSWGGSSLIYNGDIAARLCTPSELKKTREGERRPNAREEWLDTQARALFQACQHICWAARETENRA